MKPLPGGRREWTGLLLRLGIVSLLLISPAVYVTSMPGHSYSGPLQPLTEEESRIRDNLNLHVSTLAGKIGQRNMWHHEALNASADYIQAVLRGAGLRVTEQEYTVGEKVVKNIEAEITGAALPDQIVILGAHYDSVRGSPGANDNATGAAALLELARLLTGKRLDRTVRFVAFVNEEPPFFQTGHMGSRVYSKRSRERGEHIVGMLSLETIGYYSDVPNSQLYPFGFGLLYPDTGNFIGFVGNLSSRALVRRSVKAFRGSTSFPSEGIAVPGWLTGVGWSDQWSFWEEGYPALMVTDTAPFRYPHYHTSADTPDKIDYDRTARVVSGLFGVVIDLASAAKE